MQIEHTGAGIWGKRCSRCGREYAVWAETYADAVEKIRPNFSPLSHTADGLESRCRSCQSQKGHGRIGIFNRDDMLDAQGGSCGICEVPISFAQRTAFVDHDHATGKTRKVLCANCNRCMGGIDDDAWLAKALAYRDSFRG